MTEQRTHTVPMSQQERFDASHPGGFYFARNPRGKYVRIARAEGVYLYDEQGKAILDGAAGAAVVCLGHGNRRVIDRMSAQASRVTFAHTSTFVTEPVLELARRLSSYAHDPGARVYFVSGGSEGTETALKIARAYHIAMGASERHVALSRSVSYHGATLGALGMTGLLQRRRPYEPMLSQSPRVATCYCYRCPIGKTPDTCAIECADDVERTILAHGAHKISAFIVEPVIGSSAPGVSARGDYMRTIVSACHRHQALVIADEVMSGVGRTGEFLAMDHYGVGADITVLSKGLSSGYFPLAAVVVSGHVFEAIKNFGAGAFVHGFTYAGSPIGAAVGLAVLDVIEEDRLLQRVRDMGKRLLQGLAEMSYLPIVGDVRGMGLLLGLELVMDKSTRQPFPAVVRAAEVVLQECLQEGLAVYPTTGSVDGITGDNILLAPPYVITEGQVDELLDKLHRALRRATSVLEALPAFGDPSFRTGHE